MINAGDRTSDPDAFLAVLSTRFDRDTLDAHPASVVGLLPDMRIAWVNKAWRGFASANEGQPAIDERWGIGANYLDAVPAPLRAFYERLLARVPDDGAAMHPVSHAYECSSPETFRKFNMQVYGLPNRAGYVIINSLVSESPHPDSGSAAGAHPALESRYRGSNGVIVQCAHCRRVRHGRESARWDWVPDWVRQMPRETSHGLCPVCANYYYPEDRA